MFPKLCCLGNCNYFCNRLKGECRLTYAEKHRGGNDGAFVYRLVLKIFILAR